MKIIIITTKCQLKEECYGENTNITNFINLRREFFKNKDIKEVSPMVEGYYVSTEETEHSPTVEGNNNKSSVKIKISVFETLRKIYHNKLEGYENTRFENDEYNDLDTFESFATGELQAKIKDKYDKFGLHHLYNKRVDDEYSVWLYGVTKLEKEHTSAFNHSNLINALIKDVIKVEDPNGDAAIESINVFMHNGDIYDKNTKSNPIKKGEITSSVGEKFIDIIHLSSFSHTGNGVYTFIHEISGNDGSAITNEWCNNILGGYKFYEKELPKVVKDTDNSYSNME